MVERLPGLHCNKRKRESLLFNRLSRWQREEFESHALVHLNTLVRAAVRLTVVGGLGVWGGYGWFKNIG